MGVIVFGQGVLSSKNNHVERHVSCFPLPQRSAALSVFSLSRSLCVSGWTKEVLAVVIAAKIWPGGRARREIGG